MGVAEKDQIDLYKNTIQSPNESRDLSNFRALVMKSAPKSNSSSNDFTLLFVTIDGNFYLYFT